MVKSNLTDDLNRLERSNFITEKSAFIKTLDDELKNDERIISLADGMCPGPDSNSESDYIPAVIIATDRRTLLLRKTSKNRWISSRLGPASDVSISRGFSGTKTAFTSAGDRYTFISHGPESVLLAILGGDVRPAAVTAPEKREALPPGERLLEFIFTEAVNIKKGIEACEKSSPQDLRKKFPRIHQSFVL